MRSPDVPAGGKPAGHAAAPAKALRPDSPRPPAFSLSNWPVSRRLVAVIVLAGVMGLVFGGLRVASAISTANGFSRTTQMAILGQKVIVLAQAMEEERDRNAAIVAYGDLLQAAGGLAAPKQIQTRLAAALAPEQSQLASAQHATDAAAAQVRTLASQIGSSFPANTQQKAQTVLSLIDNIGGLRSESKVGGQQPQAVQAAIQDYSGAIADLFALNDEITSGSGDALLSDQVRTLDAMSRAKDQASQQRAILYGALIEGSYISVGGLTALTTAQGLEFADLLAFQSSATADEQSAYLSTVAGQQVVTAQLLSNFLSVVNDPQQVAAKFGNTRLAGKVVTHATAPEVWYDTMSDTIGRMRAVESRVAAAIVARSQSLEQGARQSATLTAGVTGGVVLLVLIATLVVARSLVDPLRRLQTDALEIATVRLPARVAELHEAADPQASLQVEPISVHSTDEIGKVARAFDQVHREAIRLAGNEAMLRGNLNTMFISLSRRSVPLIERLARMIDSLEQNEDDPDQLSNLFSMDHLVTRMRRNSENLLVLAGEEPVRKWSGPVPLADVARAATSEIEQYSRVVLSMQPGIAVSGQAAADVVHLLAEIIENATMFSPRDTPVHVSGQELTSGGALIEVRDNGVGVSSARLAEMNWRLDNPPLIDVSVSRHMGLFAVSRLAARHGVRVRLRAVEPQGLSALVWLPGNLTGREAVSPGDRTRQLAGRAAAPQPTVVGRRVPGGRHRLGLQGADDLPDIAPARAAESAATASNWFRAKRPSGARGDADYASATETWSNGGWRNGAAGAGNGSDGDWRNGAAGAGNVSDGGWRNGGTAGTESWANGGSRYAAASGGPDSDTWNDGGWRTSGAPSTPVYGDRTSAGLPVRVPRANLFPGSVGDPGSAGGGPAQDYQGTGGLPAFGRPGSTASHEADQAISAQSAPLLPRRTPEQARSRLSGFQLGSRDATGRTPRAGEEASR